MTSLPTPQQWVIRRMSKPEVAEMIERHVDFVDKHGFSVHLGTNFVRHYMQRDDHALPTIVAVSTLPLVLADGQVLAEDKFDRLRGIDFHILPELAAVIPKPGSVTDQHVKAAMRFLTDQWLVDVATDYAGKCTIIAAALTLIERSLLDQRPVFFVTAGRRGGGKTTTLSMLIKAVTGIRPAAAAWSTNEEERRKALLSYFLYSIPYILWDNIARGTQITCPHIEKYCTAAFYSDRKLGVSEMVATAASTIHFFTGNNIAPRGDLASRSLEIGSNSIAMILKTGSSSTPIRSAGPIACAPKLSVLSTSSCSATRRLRSRAMRQCVPASRCGTGWSVPQSSTPPHWLTLIGLWIFRTYFWRAKTRMRMALRWPKRSRRCSINGREALTRQILPSL